VALVRWGATTSATRVLPPKGGRAALGGVDRALSEGVAPDHSADTEDLAMALERLHRVARRPGLVVVVSDLRDDSHWERGLSLLARQHRVLVAEVSDPREQALPDAGIVVMVDPETGDHVEVDTSSARVRAAFADAEAERRTVVAERLKRCRVQHLEVSTAGDWLRDLGRALR
jgi:uncharacterized protein (DUF58 family)